MTTDLSPTIVTQEERLSKARIAELVRRYWLIVLTVFLAGTLTMYLILPIFFTDLYESTAELLVRVGRENAETPATVQRGEVVSQGVRMADINSEVQILQSRDLVEKVVDQLGPDAFKSVLAKPDSWMGYPKYFVKLAAREAKHEWSEFLILIGLEKRLDPREAAILHVSDAIKVEPVKDSDILTLKVRTPAPKLSMDVANTLLDHYMLRRTEIRRGSAGSDFFATGLGEVRERMNQALGARAAVRARYEFSAPGEQRTLDLKELSTLNSEMLENDAQIVKLRRQRELLLERASQMPESVEKEHVDASNPVLQTIKERITTLQVDRAKIASHYLPGSEVLNKVDEEIAGLQAELARQSATVRSTVTTESNPTKREFRSSIELNAVQLAGLENSNRALAAPAADLAKHLQSRERGIDELENAEREYRIAEQDYLTYSKRYEEARMSEALDNRRIANVSIAGAPDTPIKPIYPKKMFLMQIGMGVSLVLGLALAAFLEATEDRILDERGVLALDSVPYLGVVEVGGLA